MTEQERLQAILLEKRASIAASSHTLSQTERPAPPEPKACKCGQPVGKEPIWLESLGRWLNPPPVCDKCVADAQEAEREAKRQAEVQRRSDNLFTLLRAAGVGKVHASEALSGRLKALSGPTQAILDGRGAKPGLFLWGGFGRGKTLLAVQIMAQMILRLLDPKIVTVPDLLLEIRETFDDRNKDGITERDLISKYASIYALVLDDLGAEKTSDYSLQTLYGILDARYRNGIPTIITSNLSLSEVEAKLGGRIASRIIGMCEPVELQGKDRRVG